MPDPKSEELLTSLLLATCGSRRTLQNSPTSPVSAASHDTASYPPVSQPGEQRPRKTSPVLQRCWQGTSNLRLEPR